MLKLRRLIGMTNGAADSSTWTAAMYQEPPIKGKPKACANCPLRVGGEWEAGAKAALDQSTPAERTRWKRWGCHEADRPCAGMARLLKSVT